MNILITGAGSVMGQSIYKALSFYDFGESLNVHFANSEILGAGRFFSCLTAPVVCAPIFPLAKESNYALFLEEYVAEHEIDIVFSGTQHELAKIADYRDKTHKAATLPSSIAEICMDKVKTAQTLLKYGIRVPITVSLNEYLTHCPINGPVVIKPNHSSSSRNIYRFSSITETKKFLLDNRISSESFLAQELLTGEEYTCGCYIDRYSLAIQTISFKRTLTPDGATLYGEIVEDKAIDHYLIEICQALIKEGLDFGHVNIQLILTKEGPVLFEINGRLSSTEASKAHFGFNSCAAFVTNVVRQKPFLDWNIAGSGRFLRYYEELYF